MLVKDDPEKYARCSKPHASKVVAAEQIAHFLELLGEAREVCGIADVVIGIGVMLEPTKKDQDTALTVVGSFGNSESAPTLGAIVFREVTAPVLARAQQLQTLALTPPQPADPPWPETPA